MGLGLMFVPLNTVSLMSLSPDKRTEGTAMWTLIRNTGSSIGVAVVIAKLTSTSKLMHARLMENVTPFNQALADPGAAMLDPSTEVGRALLENLVAQQATIIAYANDFKMLAIMTILAYPLILLIRTPRLTNEPATASSAGP
jgi:DHA2 family multidrug resistance protein